MGIATELSYSIPPRNALQRSLATVASSRPGAWTLARVLPPIDRAVARLSRGRTTLTEQIGGLPVIVVTTTGRRSGLSRPAQLLGVPVGDDLALIGTNFGQADTPSWVLNLEAEPRATVSYGDVTLDVMARPASDSERAEVLARAAGVYVGYSTYFGRISGRHVRVFVLEEAPGPVS